MGVNPFFSVVIPAYNAAGTIGESIRSVMQQQYQDFEVVVVDDGSTDSTATVAQGLENVGYWHQQNAGPGVARNTGVKIAKGKYITFLDADDVLFPWALQTYFNAIIEHNEPSFFAGNIFLFKEDTELRHVSFSATAIRYYPNFLEAARHGLYAASCMMGVKRSAYLTAGGFIEERTNAEDHEFAIRMGTAAGFFLWNNPF